MADETKAKSNLSATTEELLAYYRDMLQIRRFEEKAGQLYGTGHIGGFCHLYIGQEAVVTGINSVQETQDTVVTSYRDHAHMLACGMDPKGIMAELTGRIDGYSRGKGGSMHMFSKEEGFFGGHGIVGLRGKVDGKWHRARVPRAVVVEIVVLVAADRGVFHQAVAEVRLIESLRDAEMDHEEALSAGCVVFAVRGDVHHRAACDIQMLPPINLPYPIVELIRIIGFKFSDWRKDSAGQT